MKHLLTELDRLYEADPSGQWSGEAAAGIVMELSERMAAAGLSHLVRSPVDEVDIIDAKRYVAECIAATAQEPDYLTPPQVAKKLGADPATVIQWIRSGQLKASNLATGHRPRYVIQPEELQAFLRMREPQQPTRKKRRRFSE